jgi:hypothetical protein
MARKSSSTLTVSTVVLAVFSFLLPCTQLQAQTQAITATISGTVSDSSGSVLPGAKISLTSSEHGISRVYVTDTGGTTFFRYCRPRFTPCK